MVMVIPPVNGVRDGTAVPARSDGRSRLLVATRAIHPNSETGRAAVASKLLKVTKAAVDPAKHCHCYGARIAPSHRDSTKVMKGTCLTGLEAHSRAASLICAGVVASFTASLKRLSADT